MKIAINSLSDYNAGTLIFKWFDVADYDDHDDFLEAVTEWLDELNEQDGGNREEWCVGDTDDVPRQYVGEYAVSYELWEYVDLINSGVDENIIRAGIELGIPLDEVQGAYRGSYFSDEDMAMEFADDIGLLEDIPNAVTRYFDWEAYARDLMIQEFNEQDGHYFRSNW